MSANSSSYRLPASHPGLWPNASGAAPAAPARPSRLLALVWEALKAVGASRGRRELLAVAREHEALRPEFAAQLRAAARRGWL